VQERRFIGLNVVFGSPSSSILADFFPITERWTYTTLTDYHWRDIVQYMNKSGTFVSDGACIAAYSVLISFYCVVRKLPSLLTNVSAEWQCWQVLIVWPHNSKVAEEKGGHPDESVAKFSWFLTEKTEQGPNFWKIFVFLLLFSVILGKSKKYCIFPLQQKNFKKILKFKWFLERENDWAAGFFWQRPNYSARVLQSLGNTAVNKTNLKV
jgi:hypothetical protein